MADQRTMAQLLQASTEGYEDAIVVPAITADNFELKHGLLTLVQNKKFFGHDKEDPHAHVRYFNKITSTLKFPNVPNTSIKLMLFPFSLEGASRILLEKEPSRSIFTWDDLVLKFINQFLPPFKTTNLRNEITNFQQRFDESFSEEWDRFKDILRACPHHGFSELHQLDTFYNALNSKDHYLFNSTAGVEESCATCGGAHSYHNCPAADGNVYRDNIQEFVNQASAINYNQGNTSYRSPIIAYTSSLSTLPSNIIANPRSDLKAITTRSGVSYDRPQILPSPSFLPKVVENKPEVKKDTVNPTNNGSTKYVQPQVVQSKSLILNSEPVTSPISEPVIALKLPKNIGDPGKFLIPCDFPGMVECLALADLGASINLMPFSVSKRLSLPDLTSTCMTLELADRSISCPVGVAEDVFVKVGSFHFPADFVVVDFDADPRVPLILGRSFLKTGRALIDVFEGELTLCVRKEAITFNLDQTLRYSANYSDMTAKQIDVIDMACEEYSQKVMGFLLDFLLEEVDAFLAIEYDPTFPKFYQPYLDPEGDLLLLEAFLNDDPSLPPQQ
nr:reverse transcriptase domain-containing protein [Tanacetum cinerariifolium]